ncbi:MAG TPA: nitroreductase family protein, partial [Candidatus Saccharimonadales bacterium]|nr:nitroreductase family protein [Candidatus Saccharimonadales bacterium]
MKNYQSPPRINIGGFGGMSPRKKMAKLLEIAVLAPSTHNTQPWKFSLGQNSIEVHMDNTRQLPAADAKKRDMYISLGALLKNLETAADELGVLDRLSISDQKTEHTATIHLKNLGSSDKPAAKAQEAVDNIASRSNYRGPFGPLELSKGTLDIIKKKDTCQTVLITDREKIEELARLTAEGLRRAYHNPAFRKEIASWIKPNSSRQKKGIPGYSLRMPMLTSHIVPRIMRIKDIGEKLAGLNYKSFVTADSVAVITAAEENPSVWIEVGRQAQDIFLAV